MSWHKRTRHAAPSVLLLLALAGAPAVAQNSPSLPIKADEATKKEAETLSQRARRDAEAYEFRAADADRPLVLRPGSMLQWTNPLGGRQAGGDVFLWTDRGRPEAVLSIYEFLDQGEVRLHHEFCSLSLGKRHDDMELCFSAAEQHSTDRFVSERDGLGSARAAVARRARAPRPALHDPEDSVTSNHASGSCSPRPIIAW